MNVPRAEASTPLGVLATDTGLVRLCTTRGALHRVVVRGHLEVAHARYIVACVDPTFEHHVVDAFCDWEEMTGYDADARRLLTDWAISRRDRLSYVCFLVSPGIVAMGVSIAAKMLSVPTLPVVTTTERARFEQLFDSRASRLRSMQ